MICSVLTGRVKQLSARLDGLLEEEQKVPVDPHKDDFSMLESYKQFMPPELQSQFDRATSRVPTPDNDERPGSPSAHGADESTVGGSRV